MESEKNGQFTRWCFTFNNPDGDIRGDFGAIREHLRYATFQLEMGENGTLHYQGYVEFTRSRRLSFCKRIIDGAHWEPARGSRDQARNYCHKEDTRVDGPWEIGVFSPLKQGKRNDLIALQADLDSGSSLRKVAQSHFSSFVRYGRGIASYRALTTPPRDFKTEVRVFYGPPGTGKSHLARLYGGDSQYWLRHSTTGVWFDNYDFEHTCVFDEFSGWMPFSMLLQLCDEYPLLVDTKGGYANFRSRSVIFTTNKMPHMWYNSTFPIEAFLRRVMCFYHFQDPDHESEPDIYTDYAEFKKAVEGDPNELLPAFQTPPANQLLCNELMDYQ